MLSSSYRSFLIMDQLRRRASISVKQLSGFLDLSESGYSRISKRVYDQEKATLQYEVEKRVEHMVRLLYSAYITGAISLTSMKQPDTIIAILEELDSELSPEVPEVLIDCNMDDLMEAASTVIRA